MRVPVSVQFCVLALVPCATATLADERAADANAIAHVADRAISLEELDAAGGRALYDLAEQLYEARVRALYQLLSAELLNREAQARGITSQALLDQEVTPHVAPITEADVDTFLKSQGSKVPNDARGRKQAQVYLGLKRQADAKRTFISQLFGKYRVRVDLAAPPPPPPETVLGPTEPVIGKVDAPVMVIAFSDYRCPYCRELSHTLDELLERYPNEVRVVYRHYPLHEDSEALAQAALCAADQGQFAEYHRSVFSNNSSAKDIATLAEAVQLDVASFNTCMKEERHRERITADMKEGQRLGITGTPTLFVAGQRLRGAQTLQRLSAAVQEALRPPAVAAAGSTGAR